MTKREFIEEVKSLGYVNWKDVLVEMGKGKRNLDRCKYDENLGAMFVREFEKWIGGGKKETPTHTIKKEKKQRKQPKTSEKTIGIDISNKDYHASDNLGSSKIKLILENAREFYVRYILKESENKKTDALIIGSLHHTLVLEPHNFERDYIIIDMPSRPIKTDYINAIEVMGGKVLTRENGKGETVVADTVEVLKEKLEKIKEKEEKTIVTKAQLEVAQATSKKALESSFVIKQGNKKIFDYKLKDLIEYDQCYVEKTFYGEINGEKVQVRPDMMINLSKSGEAWYVVDLKTAQDATMQMFARQSSAFYYDIQEYVYREILKQNGIDVREFRFCVAGKSEASKCEYFKIHQEDMEDAEKVTQAIIGKFKKCKETNEWRETMYNYKTDEYEDLAVVKMPAYRKFQMIDMGVL